MFIHAPYVPSRDDFKVEPGSLGVSYTVSCVGRSVRVASPEEIEAAITTIIEDMTAEANALHAFGVMF